MSYRKLGRTSSQRKALLRDLTTSLIVNGSITTTEPRAKEVRKTMDQMITLDVKEDGDDIKIQSALQNLFEDIAPKYADRNGGYTRILKTMPRRGDGAKMVILELV